LVKRNDGEKEQEGGEGGRGGERREKAQSSRVRASRKVLLYGSFMGDGFKYLCNMKGT